MSIKVEIRNVYGNETIYPLCEAGRTFARIAGTKTLTRETIGKPYAEWRRSRNVVVWAALLGFVINSHFLRNKA